MSNQLVAGFSVRLEPLHVFVFLWSKVFPLENGFPSFYFYLSHPCTHFYLQLTYISCYPVIFTISPENSLMGVFKDQISVAVSSLPHTFLWDRCCLWGLELNLQFLHLFIRSLFRSAGICLEFIINQLLLCHWDTENKKEIKCFFSSNSPISSKLIAMFNLLPLTLFL